VFHLSDIANAAIPPEARSQFHCDDGGRVLFFSTPPMDMVSTEKKQLGHSLKYLAAKAAKEEKRKRRQEEESERMSLDEEDEEEDRTTKRARLEEEIDPSRVHKLVEKTLAIVANDISAGTDGLYKSLYGDNKELAAEIRIADRKQYEHNVQAYILARRVVDEINSQTIDDSAPRVSDLKRGGAYLEDVN
jgi:chromatin structure-remodeling complex subunit RSC1/2